MMGTVILFITIAFHFYHYYYFISTVNNPAIVVFGQGSFAMEISRKKFLKQGLKKRGGLS